MEPRRGKNVGVLERAIDTGEELRFAAGNRCAAAFSRGPIARGSLNNTFTSPCPRATARYPERDIVGKRNSTAVKPARAAASNRCGKQHLGEHHAQVRGEARHGSLKI